MEWGYLFFSLAFFGALCSNSFVNAVPSWIDHGHSIMSGCPGPVPVIYLIFDSFEECKLSCVDGTFPECNSVNYVEDNGRCNLKSCEDPCDGSILIEHNNLGASICVVPPWIDHGHLIMGGCPGPDPVIYLIFESFEECKRSCVDGTFPDCNSVNYVEDNGRCNLKSCEDPCDGSILIEHNNLGASICADPVCGRLEDGTVCDYGGGTCTVYVETNGGTCSEYCDSYGLECYNAWDDSNHECRDEPVAPGISEWDCNRRLNDQICVCQEGNPKCAVLLDSVLCDSDQIYCSVYVETNGSSCDDYCTFYNLNCFSAIDDDDHTCVTHGNSYACTTNMDSQICHCV